MTEVKWYQKAEMLIGLSALVVSLVAVGVGVYSAVTDRTYAKASVWPRLIISTNVSTSDNSFSEIGVKISNKGTGPAIIKSLRVWSKDTEIKQWNDIVEPHKTLLKSYSLTKADISKGVISADQTFVLFSLRSQSLKIIEQYKEKIFPTKLEVCYCSIYDECWKVVSDNKPTPVQMCEVTASNF